MSRATASGPAPSPRRSTFAAPEIEILDFPSWDCQPYDRVSPNAAISARRILVLSRLARSRTALERPRILSTTINALLQRVAPSRQDRGGHVFRGAGQYRRIWDALVAMARNQRLRARLDRARYRRLCGARRHPRSFRARHRRSRSGSISSATRSNRSAPSIPRRSARPDSSARLDLVPMSEVQLTTETMRRFRQAYVTPFRRADARRHALRSGERRPPPSGPRTLAAALLRQARHSVRLYRPARR